LLLVLLGLPLLLGIAGWARSGSARAQERPTSHEAAISLLTYTLAFNLTFFIQELFLVVPKAFVPGLHPVLFHNDHDWTGTNPLAELFEGTGAAAILVSGILFAFLAKFRFGRSEAVRFLIVWMAYNGLFMGLLQWALAPLLPHSDTGRALAYLQVPHWAQLALGLTAILAMVAAAIMMTARFLEVTGTAFAPAARPAATFRLALLPALLAIPILVLYRVPREWSEVLLPTIAVPLTGLSWVQSWSWWIREVHPDRPARHSAVAICLFFALGLLGLFQLVLRPGIRF
jgi:hypothetical protein